MKVDPPSLNQEMVHSLEFTKMVRNFQQAVHHAGGVHSWDHWKDVSLENAFSVLCTNRVQFVYRPERHYLSEEQLYPNT